ncbi:MAG: IclR family transcriptional regulator [Rhodospirillaceae bacterium]
MTLRLPTAGRPDGTQSVQRAAAVLRTLASHNRAGLRVVDLCEMTGLKRPTVHRLLQCLARERLVVRNARTRNYHLGPMLYELGLTAAPAVKLDALCRPHLRALADATGDMAFLTLRSGFDAVCIDRQEGEFWIRTYTLDVGTRRPLGIGAGSLAILAALDDRERSEVLAVNRERYPAYNDASALQLGRMAKQTQRRGFAIHDGSVSGARAIGIPVYDASGAPIAGVSVSAIMSRMEEKRWPELVRRLRECADAIQRGLKASAATVPLTAKNRGAPRSRLRTTKSKST